MCYQLAFIYGFKNWSAALVIGLLIILRSIVLNDKIIFVTVIIFGISGLIFGTLKPNTLIYSERPFAEKILVLPDTIEVKGDYASFTGVIIGQKWSHKRFKAGYVISSKQEAEFIRSIYRPLTADAIGNYTEIDTARNLHSFDQADYYKSKRYLGKIQLTRLKFRQEYQPSMVNISLHVRVLRKRALLYCSKKMPRLSSYFFKVFFLGYQDSDEKEIMKNWKKLGILHIFSLSGMHIFFFIVIFRYILLRLGTLLEVEFFLEIIFIICLCLITGSAVGMLRAGMQSIFNRGSLLIKYKLSALDIWSLTLMVHSLFNPFILLTIGGQLSYYLSFCIIIIQPVLLKCKDTFSRFILFDALLCFLSLPIIWFYFYEWNVLTVIFSLVFANLILYIFMPLLLASSILSLFFGPGIFLFCEVMLKLLEKISAFLANIDLFQIIVGRPPIIIVILLIICQFFLIYLLTQKEVSIILGIYISLCFILLANFKWFNPFGITAFVDVGQGDAIFIKEPFNGPSYLIDTGGQKLFRQKESWRRSKQMGYASDYHLVPFIKSQGTSKIDKIFITHAHEDHFGDLENIATQFSVQQLITTTGAAKQSNFSNILKKISFKTLNTVEDNYFFKSNYVTFRSLSPKKSGDGGNNDSLVLSVELSKTKILLMGDLESDGEEWLLHRYRENILKCDILKLGHHGSKTSSSIEFLAKTMPDYAVASCGVENRYGHPSPEVIRRVQARNIHLFRTDLDGMVYFKWTGYQNNKIMMKKMLNKK